MNLPVFHTRYSLPLAALCGLVEEAVVLPHHRQRLLDLLTTLQIVFATTEESDLVTHSIFLRPLAHLEEAKDLFRYLHHHRLLGHPEEPAEDWCAHDGTPLFTPGQACELNARMSEAYTFDWQEHDCPCGFILDITATENPVI